MPPRRGAPYGNKNAANQSRVERQRIQLNLSLSYGNGFLPLSERYLAKLGLDTSDDAINRFASEWFYANYGEWLKRHIERDETIIL